MQVLPGWSVRRRAGASPRRPGLARVNRVKTIKTIKRQAVLDLAMLGLGRRTSARHRVAIQALQEQAMLDLQDLQGQAVLDLAMLGLGRRTSARHRVAIQALREQAMLDLRGQAMLSLMLDLQGRTMLSLGRRALSRHRVLAPWRKRGRNP